MTSEPIYDGPDDDATRAGEYVLGLVSGDERRALEARIAAEPAFAALVEAWAVRLQPLADGIPPAEPPARVWSALDAAVGDGAKRPSLWNSVRAWRWATGVSATAAAAALGLLVTLPMRPPEPAFDASFQATSQDPGFLARIDGSAERLVIHPISLPADGQRVPELWVIPRDGRPRSLGVIAATRDSEVVIPADHAQFITPDSTLAVTMEPPGGAPGGQPTGPVVASGKLEKI